MILPQVHLRKPCYDFYFLEIAPFYADRSIKSNTRSERCPLPRHYDTIHSVVATGGVYKGQGLNPRDLMNRTY